MKHACNILALSLILLTAVPACAQDYPNGILDRDAVIEAAKSVTTEAYPNADTVVVDGHVIVHYNADGTNTRWDDTVVKVLTEAGKRDNQTGGFYFTIPYDELKLTLLEVIKPDGRVEGINITMNSRVIVDPDQMAMNIYNPNRKVLGYRVPSLEIGDMVRYVYRRKAVKTRMPDAFYDYELAEYTFPIKHYVYEVFAPKDLPLRKLAVRDEIPGTITHTSGEQDGRLHYRWDVRDVPRMYREPNMPPLSRVVQRVHGSTLENYQSVSRWYWKLCEPHINATTPDMQATVDELTAGLTDRQAKIEAIFYWVSQKVRYMGITTETEAPGYEPHEVRITFENKYGVCRDKAALLAAMLRLAGFEANTVLIHADTKKDPEVPDAFFNHAITAVREPDGSWQLMDCTSDSAKQLLPGYLCDRNYLVATEAGEGLATSPLVPAEDNLVRIESTGTLSASGELTLRSVLRFEGINDNSYRGYFSRIKPDERRQFFERLAKGIVAGARLTRLEITPADMQDTSQPLLVRMDIVAQDFLVTGDRCSTMRVPLVGTSVGMVNFILDSTGLAERKYPLKTEIACGIRETMRIELPDGLGEAVLPSFETIDDETVSWRRSLKIEDGQLLGTNECLIKVVEFPPEQYLQLKRSLQTIEYNGRKIPIFPASQIERPAPPSTDLADPDSPLSPTRAAGELVGPNDDRVILDRRVTYDVKDTHTWTERRYMKQKILTHAGRKAFAEERFRYNTAWETVRLVSGSVIAPDGTVKDVRDEEINVMDAGWVATAPRYPAEKILVVSFPNVEVGSIMEYEIERTYRHRPFFYVHEIFRSTSPAVRKHVQLRAPADLPLTVLLRFAESITMTQSVDGDTVVYEWSTANVTSFRSESYAPWYSWTYQPTILASAGNWPDYARQISDALEAAAGDAPAATAKARQLVEGLEGDEARILAIRDFIASNIRSVSISLDDAPLSTFTPADRILAEGYGHYADRAILLAAMLRAVGYEPTFVLKSLLHEIPLLTDPLRQCPQPSAFFDVFLRVLCDGQETDLDAYSQYGRLGATGDHSQLGLILPAGDVFTIYLPENKRNYLQRGRHIALTDAGDATIEITRTYHGYRHGAMNQMFAEMPPEQRRRYHQQAVAAISQSAKADGDLVTDFETYPGRVSFSVKAGRFAVRDGDYLYLHLPTGYVDLILPDTDTRETPIYWPRKMREAARITVELPEGFTDVLLAPLDIDWEAPAGAGHVTRRVTREDQPSPRLMIEYDVDLKAAVIPAEHYDRLLEIQRLLTHPRAHTIVLRKSKP